MASASDAFHVVIPSMPGYGFTEQADGRPAGVPSAWAGRGPMLMQRLGYTRYVAQGGDWGAFVVDQMGLQAPAGLLAHPHQHARHRAGRRRQGAAGRRVRRRPGSRPRNDAAYGQLERTFKQVDYARLMASRPQTLYGIADSPVGLAAWLLDHNDADGQPAATVAAALNRTHERH